MSALLRGLVFGYARRNVLRSTITVIAVALGVAIALAIDLANHTAVASFGASVEIISNHVNLQVLGIGNGFDERALLRVENIDGIAYAGPVIEDELVIGAKPGAPLSGEILHVLGVDVLRPLPAAASGSSFHSGLSGLGGSFDPDVMVNAHGAIVSDRVARAYGLQVGTHFRALSGPRAVALRVTGVFSPQASGVDSSVVFVDIATAQEAFGKLGRLDRIDCVVDPALVAQMTSRVQAVVPPGARVIQPRVRTAEIRRMLRSFEMNLAALSYVALLVGAFLIYNTVAISVVQRRADIGIVRGLGASRAAIFTTFIIEGTVFGIAGAAAGCALGALLAQGSVRAVSRTVETLYVASHADRVVYDPLLFIKALAAGVALAMVSAAVPAFEAARTLPAAAMRSSALDVRSPRRIGLFAIAAVIVLAVAYGATFLPPLHDTPVFGYLSGLLIIAGVSLLTPAAVEGVARIAVRARGATLTIRLAATNARRSLFRTSVAVASLAVAVAMMVAVAVLVTSFRATVVAWANDTITADLFIRPPGAQDASYDARFPQRLAGVLRSVPGVAALDTFRGVSVPFEGRLISFGSSDFSTLATRAKLRFVGSVDAPALARRLPGSMQALISEPLATRAGLGTGDRIRLPTSSGERTFLIAGVYNDYSSDAGSVLIDQRTFRRLFHDDSVNAIAVYAAGGADVAQLRTRLIRAAAPLEIDVQTSRDLRAFVLTVFNRTFAITYALYVISIAIAVLGVVSTLFALVLERRAEIGILRYLGLSRGGVRRMVYGEACIVGALGGIEGILAGIALSLVLIYVINRQAFGWLIELHIPYAFLAEALVMVVVAALLAGVWPAALAARIRTADAVRAE